MNKMEKLIYTEKLINRLRALQPDSGLDNAIDIFEQYRNKLDKRYTVYIIDNTQLQQDEIALIDRLARFKVDRPM